MTLSSAGTHCPPMAGAAGVTTTSVGAGGHAAQGMDGLGRMRQAHHQAHLLLRANDVRNLGQGGPVARDASRMLPVASATGQRALYQGQRPLVGAGRVARVGDDKGNRDRRPPGRERGRGLWMLEGQGRVTHRLLEQTGLPQQGMAGAGLGDPRGQGEQDQHGQGAAPHSPRDAIPSGHDEELRYSIGLPAEGRDGRRTGHAALLGLEPDRAQQAVQPDSGEQVGDFPGWLTAGAAPPSRR